MKPILLEQGFKLTICPPQDRLISSTKRTSLTLARVGPGTVRAAEPVPASNRSRTVALDLRIHNSLRSRSRATALNVKETLLGTTVTVIPWSARLSQRRKTPNLETSLRHCWSVRAIRPPSLFPQRAFHGRHCHPLLWPMFRARC